LIRSEKDLKGSPLTVEDILHYQKISKQGDNVE